MDFLCVSVIIPCYNMETYLADCLDSVLSQTLSDIELICVDDGSTDATGGILDAAAQKDPRIRVFHQHNQGVAAARNHGIQAARGRYIAFLDPDDFYPNRNTLNLLYTKAEENGALICGGSFSSYHNQTGRVTTCYTGDSLKNSFAKEGFVRYRDYQFDFGYHRFLYRRSFLMEHQLFFPPYRRFQDPPFFVRAMILADRFYAVPDVVYRYRVDIQAPPTSWPAEKLHDMMRGYLDNLHLSREHDLPQLHALTVRRFEQDNVYVPVMKSLHEQNETTSELLQQIHSAIYTPWLAECGMVNHPDKPYPLRQYVEYTTGEKQILPGGTLYTIKQKIRRLAHCWQERGFGYILKMFTEHLCR